MKIIKAVHILFAAVSFGGLVASLSILYLKVSGQNLILSDKLDLMVYVLNNTVIYYGVLGTFVTALIYALYTNWVFLKYYWIITKWLLFVSLAILFIWFFIPTINGMASLSDSGLNIEQLKLEYVQKVNTAFYLNILIIVIYTIIFFVSTMKPFRKREKDIFSNKKRLRLVVWTVLVFMAGMGLLGKISIEKMRNMPIEDSDLSISKDGVYEGQFEGGGGIYTAKVEIKEFKIISIEQSSSRQSKYVTYAEPVMLRIIEKQNANVDAITGATTTSKCFMKAVENALKIQ